MIQEHFKKLQARLDVSISWYHHGQKWFEDDPGRGYHELIADELTTTIHLLITFGCNIEYSLYKLSNREFMAQQYKDVWGDFFPPVTEITSFLSGEIRQLFILSQNQQFPEIEDRFRITAFMGQLCLYLITNNQVMYQIQEPPQSEQKLFLDKYPNFLRKWENFSNVKRWYYITSALCYEWQETDPNHPEYVFTPNPNINYDKELSDRKLIITREWTETLAHFIESRTEFQQVGEEIQQAIDSIKINSTPIDSIQ
jgi:hypothetical protein